MLRCLMICIIRRLLQSRNYFKDHSNYVLKTTAGAYQQALVSAQDGECSKNGCGEQETMSCKDMILNQWEHADHECKTLQSIST